MRNVRISAISYLGNEKDPEDSCQGALEIIDRAMREGPDLIVLPEASLNRPETAQPLPGPIYERMAAKAAEHGIYLVLPLYQLTPSEAIYNSAILISPEGDRLGQYLKKYPNLPELNAGVTPGDDTPVFSLPFGRVGMAICFDLNFRDVADGLAAGNVELIFFLSMYEGGRQLQTWAFDYGVYMVSAHLRGYSTFVDPLGRIIQRGEPLYHPIVTRDLNLDRSVYHLDENHKRLDEVRRRYGKGIKIEVCRPEAVFTLESLMDDMSVEDIAGEFSLETRSNYYARSIHARDKVFNEVGVEGLAVGRN